MRRLVCTALAAALLLTGCAAPSEMEDVPETAAPTDAPDSPDDAAPEMEAPGMSAAENAVTALPNVRSFTAATLDGGQFTSEDVAAADVTVINIWQTTCPPCIAEMGELAALEASLPENVQLVTWCLDAPNDPALAKQILEDNGFAGQTLTVADGDLLLMVQQVMYTPTTVFLGSDGTQLEAELIGSPHDLAGTYRAYINDALAHLGKDPLPEA